MKTILLMGGYIKSALLSKGGRRSIQGLSDAASSIRSVVLYFHMDAELLDVNVHPTKMELRFSQNEQIYRSAL